mgnify:CR=1 FL=1
MRFKEIIDLFKNTFLNETPDNQGEEEASGVPGSRLLSIFQRSFFRNVSIVAVGPVFSQAMSIILSPIITRLYDPAEYGALGVFLSVLSVLVPISNLSYSYAIIMPEREKDGFRILRFTILFGLFISLLTLFIIILFNKEIAALLKIESYAVYLYLLPLTLFFSTSAIAFDQWMVRKKQFKASSGILVSQSVLSNGALIGLGYLVPQYASLIGINIFTRGYHMVAAWLVSDKPVVQDSGLAREKLTENIDETRRLLREYRDFPFFRTPQILLSTLTYNLPIMMMTAFSGPAAAGLYSLAHRVLKLPSIILSESFSKVFLQRVNETAHSGRSLQHLIIKATLLLVVVGSVPLGVIILFGPSLFSFVFGMEWFQAGQFARWMAVWVLVSFCGSPAIVAVPFLALQKQYLVYEIISLVLGTLGLITGFMILNDDILAVALFACIIAVVTAIWMVFVIVKSKNLNRYQLKEAE